MSQKYAVLMAGAGPKTSRRAVAFHDLLLQRLGSRKPRIAYVGAAADDNVAFAAVIRTLVFGLGAKVVPVKLTKRTQSTSAIRDALAGADMVFFTGGDVKRGMELINARGLAPYLCELAEQGKPMEGISAGSILLGRHWVHFPDDNDDHAEVFPCLGIVPFSMDTHGEEDGWSELQALARLLPPRGAEPEVFGIPSGGCAILDGNRLVAAGAPLARFSCGQVPTRLADIPVDASVVSGG